MDDRVGINMPSSGMIGLNILPFALDELEKAVGTAWDSVDRNEA